MVSWTITVVGHQPRIVNSGRVWLRVFQKSVLSMMFGPREEVVLGRHSKARKLNNERHSEVSFSHIDNLKNAIKFSRAESHVK
jgi:hypothetical protein